MAEGLPDLFEYIGGSCPPPPEPTGDEEADEVALDQYERMKAFWVDTVCEMEPDQRAEYNRIESTLEFASKELLRRGSMKLLGTMLATTIGWPDFCHDKWAEDDDLADAINGMATNPDKQAPPLLGQSFLKHFNHEFDSDTETLLLTHPETRETDRISLVKNGGVYWLDVTFNGSKTRRFIYDTGASSISMPIMMASELGMAPKPSDPEHMVMVADGRHVSAKSVTAKSVRVGKFTVNDVECSIDIPGNNTHTVGYWDKPNDKSIDNWMGVLTPNVLDADKVYPKEQRLLDICLLHKKAGNQVWVYCQMTGKRNVMPRLKSILEKNGLRVGILKSGDVDPKEREEWIAKNGRQYDVMICFPQLVSTGLDLFSKVQGGHNYNCIVFYETGYKLNDMRQAARRSWRIGQPKDCYLYYLYYETSMQHRAMSLMSKKMAAALALEGEFSEEGLAAMAGDDNLQMALAKSMSEKIDSADMQRSWSKVTSSDKKKAKKKPTEKVATLAADAKPSPLDNFPEEFQLLGQTLLDRKDTPAPASAIPGIEALAARFAQADAGMWAAARNVAFGGERAKVETEPEPKFTMTPTSTIKGFYIPSEPEPESANPGVAVIATPEAKPKLKVHKPEPKPDPLTDDFELDEELLAEMFANLASHGMTLEDLITGT
jgi:clan AA aspartic protease (TIGR02281 family)